MIAEEQLFRGDRAAINITRRLFVDVDGSVGRIDSFLGADKELQTEWDDTMLCAIVEMPGGKWTHVNLWEFENVSSQ